MAQMPKTIAGCPVVVHAHHEQANGPYDVKRRRPNILCGTFLTTGAPRMYDISDQAMRIRSHDGGRIKIIHGGVHATSLPTEAIKHCHMVVRGEVTPEFQAYCIKQLFWQNQDDREIVRLEKPPLVIRRPPGDLSWMNKRKFIFPWVTSTSSGCPFGCPFCSVTEVFGPRMRTVAEDMLRAELLQMKSLGARIVAYIDDNFLQGVQPDHIKHCLMVSDVSHEYGMKWVTEVTVRTLIQAQEKLDKEGFKLDLIKYFAEHGCRGLFFGIETVDEGGAGLSKSRGMQETLDLIRKCHDNGIGILGAFVLGVGDDEDADYYKRVLDFAHLAKLDFMQTSINTPMPGSQDFITATRDGRIFNHNYECYDAEHCVMWHPRLSPAQLQEAHRRCYEEFYSWRSIADRTLGPLLEVDADLRLVHPKAWQRAPFTGIANAFLHGVNRSWNDRSRNEHLPVVSEPDPAVAAMMQAVLSNSTGNRVDLFRFDRPQDERYARMVNMSAISVTPRELTPA